MGGWSAPKKMQQGVTTVAGVRGPLCRRKGVYRGIPESKLRLVGGRRLVRRGNREYIKTKAGGTAPGTLVLHAAEGELAVFKDGSIKF